ncbi:MAG: multiprotein bridging factor aMBF1 [Promethearchaeota archaeon]
MPKSKYNEIDKECPICGSIIWGKGQRVLLEGAKITVCHNCAQHGTKIHKSTTPIKARSSYHQKSTQISRKINYKKNNIDNLEIIQDYDKKIREIRLKLRLNQDQFAHKMNEKPSLIRRIESRKVKPTIKLAKKIGKVFNINLLEKINDFESITQQNKFIKKSKGSSLGDIAFIKKKK